MGVAEGLTAVSASVADASLQSAAAIEQALEGSLKCIPSISTLSPGSDNGCPV